MQLADTPRMAANRAYVERFDITESEPGILATVSVHQSITASALSRMPRIDRGWVGRTIGDLQHRKPIVREPHGNDDRGQMVSPTKDGKTRLDRPGLTVFVVKTVAGKYANFVDMVRAVLPYFPRRIR